MTVSVAVSGATGRLGELVCRVVDGLAGFELAARLTSASKPEEGAQAAILFDVSHPEASPAIVERALQRGQRVIVGTMLASIAAPYFDSIEIIEAHHPRKVDSPSGTAVRTAELIAAAKAAGEPASRVEAPFAEQPARGQLVAGVPVHSIRLAGVVAKQEVRFGGTGETLTVTHDTLSSESYVAGIRAALEAIGRLEGLVVGLENVLGLKR